MFARMVEDLMKEPLSEIVKIQLKDYENWQKQYTWDALQNIRYGQSFCNQYNITDLRLYYSRDWVFCDRLIRKEYITRPWHSQ
jgi:hypothetical protein